MAGTIDGENRKIFAKLEQRLESGNRKAAFLDGARQVGKSTAVRELARRHFDNFVEVSLSKAALSYSLMKFRNVPMRVLQSSFWLKKGSTGL